MKLPRPFLLRRIAPAWLVLFCTATPLVARDAWLTLNNCRYIPNAADDGDSFHVQASGKEYIFRIYYVDSPETDPGLGDRVEEQAKYFGVKIPQVLQVGEAAKNFTREKLSHPFVVRTCMQDALGRSKMERFYAFVEVDGTDLGEQLVANGLARLHGVGSKPPGMNSPEREWQKLDRLEKEAKRQKIGGWGAAAGRINVRLPTPHVATAGESFEAFFHPPQVATPAPSSTAVAAAPPRPAKSVAPATSAAAKLNVNTASEEELDNLPGIGPTLAARIIAARPFKSADDLQNVKGIGPAKYEKIRSFFE